MKTEFLKGLGLSQEVIDKIMAENGKDIEAEQKKTSKAEQERDGYRESADDWKQKAEDAKAEADQKIQSMQFDYAISDAITGAKAKNAKAVKALLNMDSLKFNDGEIIGLDKQIETLKSENDYLFESDKPAPKIVKGTGGGDPLPGAKKPSEMNYTELCEYMEQNPEAEI